MYLHLYFWCVVVGLLVFSCDMNEKDRDSKFVQKNIKAEANGLTEKSSNFESMNSHADEKTDPMILKKRVLSKRPRLNKRVVESFFRKAKWKKVRDSNLSNPKIKKTDDFTIYRYKLVKNRKQLHLDFYVSEYDLQYAWFQSKFSDIDLKMDSGGEVMIAQGTIGVLASVYDKSNGKKVVDELSEPIRNRKNIESQLRSIYDAVACSKSEEGRTLDCDFSDENKSGKISIETWTGMVMCGQRCGDVDCIGVGEKNRNIQYFVCGEIVVREDAEEALTTIFPAFTGEKLELDLCIEQTLAQDTSPAGSAAE